MQSDKGKAEYLREIDAFERFLNDPWLIKASENATVQVEVPKVVPSPAGKRVELQKQGAAVSIVGEDYARRFGSADLVVRVSLALYCSCCFKLTFHVFFLLWVLKFRRLRGFGHVVDGVCLSFMLL